MDQRAPPGSAEDVTARADDDETLLAALQRRDTAAFEALVRTQAPRLLAVARRYTGNEEDARDCVQDTFLAVHRKIDGFEGRSSLATWLHRIVVNAALSRLRTRRRDAEESIDELLPRYDGHGYLIGPTTMPALTADALLERAGTGRAVAKALDRLPADYRTVVLLRDIEGYDTQEVAELLAISPGAVKTRLHRARSALKTLLEPLMREDKA